MSPPCPTLHPCSFSFFIWPFVSEPEKGRAGLPPSSRLIIHLQTVLRTPRRPHLLLGSQPRSRCRPANRKAAAERKAPARPPSCSSAYRSRDKVFQLFPTRQMLRGQRGGRGTGAGGGEPCGRPHRYHTQSTHTPLDPLQNLTATSPPPPHTETLNMLPAPATPAWCPQPVPLDNSRSL